MKHLSWKFLLGTAGLIVAIGSTVASAEEKPAAVLSELHEANQNEIHMGRMAKEKSQSQDVQAYGDRLMKDHKEADDKVISLAKKDGIALQPATERGMMAKHDASEASKV